MKSPRFRADLRGLAPNAARSLFKEDSVLNRPEYNLEQHHENQLMGGIPCLNMSSITNYLNRADVRRALHIKPDAGEWVECSDRVGQKYDKHLKSMVSQIRQAINSNLRVLLQYITATLTWDKPPGAMTNTCCQFGGGAMLEYIAQAIRDMLLARKRSWMYTDQIAGFVTQYKGLDFVTVKGAGHMAPQWRAPQSSQMILRYLNDEPY